jgi:hypothetical protein
MMVAREGKTCSFCGEPGSQDLQLVGGLGAQICVTCVDDFHEIIHDPAKTAAIKGRFPWESMSDAELLATLPQIMVSAEQNNHFAHEWVDLLRERSISWAEIGRTLGVSRQAAWERFARKGGDKSETA